MTYSAPTGLASAQMLDLPATSPAEQWSAFSAILPEPIGALLGMQRVVWDHVDPALLELARLRFAQLLGADYLGTLRSEQARAAGLTEATIAQLSDWPTAPVFADRERACLTLAEQFLIDVNGVSDDQTDAVLVYLTPKELFAYVNALWVFEQFQRFCLVLDLRPGLGDAGLTIEPATEGQR